MAQWYEKYTAEEIKELCQPYADQLELAGYRVEWNDQTGVWNDYYSNFCIYYMDNAIGSIGLNYFGDETVNKITFDLDTKVTFEMKSTFTKSGMNHKIKVKTNVRRSVTDFKKFKDWLDLIARQYKTAMIKKTRFEADTDFE